MEVLIEVLFWIVVYIVDAFSGRRKRTLAQLEKLAERRGGVFEKGNWLHDATVRLLVEGVPARVCFRSALGTSPPEARITFDWTPPATLRVVPEDAVAKVKKWFGAADLQLGNPEFDRHFLVQGSEESWTRTALAAPAQAQFLGLARRYRKFEEPARVSLIGGPAGLTIRVEGAGVGEGDSLDGIIDGALAIFRGLHDATWAGVHLLPAAESAAAGRCPVCAEPLAGEVRRCATCGSLHHAECWEYFGRCAIYACNSHLARSVRVHADR